MAQLVKNDLVLKVVRWMKTSAATKGANAVGERNATAVVLSPSRGVSLGVARGGVIRVLLSPARLRAAPAAPMTARPGMWYSEYRRDVLMC